MDPASLCIALIPARGGSKGVSKKNVRQLCGRPLLAHSIEQAAQTPAIKRVFVSTDDEEIAAIARHYGADVIVRPPELSTDTATSESALLHALDHLRDTENLQPDLIVFLQATSPLRQPHDIQRAIETLEQQQADSLFSACAVQGFLWQASGDEVHAVNYDPTNRQRRQELNETTLEENGSIYIFKPWVLRELDNRLGGKIATYQMTRLDSFQVDDPADLELLEQLLPTRHAPVERTAFRDVRLLVLDFDGVLTDNRVLVNQDGVESVCCHRGDGWGIARARETGIEIVVISTEANSVVAARCRKLNVRCIQASLDKLAALKALVSELKLRSEQVAYVGNDVNDLECLKWVGMPIVVNDAVPEVRSVARFQTTLPGGWGAVREVADWLLSARKELS